MNGLTADQAVALRNQLNSLREAYGARLVQKAQSLQEDWESYLNLPEGEERCSALTDLHRQAHTVAGSGGTFGFVAASETARRAEIVLKSHLNDARPFSPEEVETVTSALKQLVVDASEQAAQKAEIDVPVLTGEAGPADLPAAEYRAQRRILLFTDQSELPPWAASLQAFGYEIKGCFTTGQLAEAAKEEIPAVIVADCSVPPLQIVQDGIPLSGAIATLQEDREPRIPIIWTCRSGSMENRIQAVRLGGSAYFPHPVDADALLVKLDDFTSRQNEGPYRVLIVDDEPSLGRLFSLILSQAGMETCVLSDPMTIMEPLVDFRPDIILMDVYMPSCSGVELAAVIRQQEAYVGIPIVFLSVESDVVKQLEAMRQGGDDFLMKPVQPRQLVSAVTTRASRARQLQNLMQRDSLTGLLNHTKIKEQLSIEMDRARRLGNPVALAMLDIDHFKTVNDTHGHATGDRVLRSLSRLLLQRLRQTDVVGRYGGEEFAIIMNGTDRGSAVRVLEKVRHAFECVKHWSGGQEFTVTFSAGIAVSPPYQDAGSLSEAADAALYEAKRAGRNRILLADDTTLIRTRQPLK